MNPRNYPHFPDGEADVSRAYTGLRDSVSADLQAIIDGDITVGEQQAAIPNADGTLADVNTKLNAVLAALRARGEIAS